MAGPPKGKKGAAAAKGKKGQGASGGAAAAALPANTLVPAAQAVGPLDALVTAGAQIGAPGPGDVGIVGLAAALYPLGPNPPPRTPPRL